MIKDLTIIYLTLIFLWHSFGIYNALDQNPLFKMTERERQKLTVSYGGKNVYNKTNNNIKNISEKAKLLIKQNTLLELKKDSRGHIDQQSSMKNQVYYRTSKKPQFIKSFGKYAAGPSKFKFPVDIAASPDGSIYVADSRHYRIQKFDSEGVFITMWGKKGLDEPDQFLQITSISVDSDGKVYVIDGYDIKVYSQNGVFQHRFGGWSITNGHPCNFVDMAIGKFGTVFVLDEHNNRVLLFKSSGDLIQEWSEFAETKVSLSYPSGIDVADDGSVYIADLFDSRTRRIQHFSSDGILLNKWRISVGDVDTGGPPWTTIACSPDESVYVAEEYKIHRFNSKGRKKGQWGNHGSDVQQFDTIRGISVSSIGNVYVVEWANHRVQYFNDSGIIEGSWGKEGREPGQFDSPNGVAVDSDGSVYVADAGNNRIQKFSPFGKYKSQWGSFGWKGTNGEFRRPAGVAISPDNYIYIGDSGNRCVQKFDLNGEWILSWGGAGDRPGEFGYLEGGISVANDGSVYVADAGNNRIQKFNSSGMFLLKWGKAGKKPGKFNIPLGISVSPKGYVYVADTMNNRIQKFTAEGIFRLQWGKYGLSEGEFDQPTAICATRKGFVYVADGNSRLQRFNENGVSIKNWRIPFKVESSYGHLRYINISKDGLLYVTDDSHGVHILNIKKKYVFIRSVALRGKVRGGDVTLYTSLYVRIEGEDSYGQKFYSTAKLSRNGKYSFNQFPKGAYYNVSLKGFDSSVYDVKPIDITGKAEGNKELKSFVLTVQVPTID